jgi:hypothetical protein
MPDSINPTADRKDRKVKVIRVAIYNHGTNRVAVLISE